MAIVLGVDAAWTPRQPSGVALIDARRRCCLSAAPSYVSFLETAQSKGETQWADKQLGGEPPVAELLSASQALSGRPVDVVAVDMPIATVPITGRRAADNAVSREFGGRWCAAHTPNAVRPGPLGAIMAQAFESLGYPIATSSTAPGTPKRLVEVYPHPALLALLDRDRRVPYKVAKIRRYWPDEPPAARRAKLMAELRSIEAGLVQELGTLPFSVPTTDELPTTTVKAYEDALDATVSAWVGSLYALGSAVPLGDDTAAIWCPTGALRPT